MQPSQKFWFEDATLFLHVDGEIFRVHKTLLYRHSRALPTWPSSYDLAYYGIDVDITGADGCIVVTVPAGTQAQAQDVEALLEHLYHDVPLSAESTFPRIAAVLRASSPQQFDFPAIHKMSVGLIEKMFPSGPEPFSHPDYFLKEALDVSVQFQISSIQKGLYYSLVTTCNFDTTGVATTSSGSHALSPLDAQRCTRLMNQLISHFTPILFTPATTPHMLCTNVFADMWMTLVIQPALECDGVYKPLETLQKMVEIDWVNKGLCEACTQGKRAEWKAEQEIIWLNVDQWLALADHLDC